MHHGFCLSVLVAVFTMETGVPAHAAAPPVCVPNVLDVAFLFDNTFSNYLYVTTFFKNVTNFFDFAPSRTRISTAIVNSATTLLFNFTKYTTTNTVFQALDNVTRSNGTTSDSTKALQFAMGTMFTTQNGERSDVRDVLIMIINSVNTKGVDIEAQKLKNKGVYLMIGEKNVTSPSLLKNVADVYFTFDAATQINQKDVNTIAEGFPCYYCGTYFFAFNSPLPLSKGNDASVGYLYLMTDFSFQVSCCGVTSVWEFFAVNFGTVEMMVFRQTGKYTYYLVGSTKIIVPAEYVNTVVSFETSASERITILAGDTFGWYTRGPNTIGYVNCTTSTNTNCPQSNKKLIQKEGVSFTPGQNINFSSAVTIPNRGYSIKVATINKTELQLSPSQIETAVEENAQIGYKTAFIEVIDTDLNDNITWNLTGEYSNFILSGIKNSFVSLDLRAKLPSGRRLPYIMTVIGTDSCQHTASATVTVSVYNEPPIINNLPFIKELSETTKTSVHLFTIDVTDVDNDKICCTIPYSIPISNNFEFHNDSGVYSIWTVKEPAFAFNEINSYRIFVCCQDFNGSSTNYLFLRITENKKAAPYSPPDWFYRALIVSLVPIAIMALVACVTLVITMFFLDEEPRESKEKRNQRTKRSNSNVKKTLN